MSRRVLPASNPLQLHEAERVWRTLGLAPGSYGLMRAAQMSGSYELRVYEARLNWIIQVQTTNHAGYTSMWTSIYGSKVRTRTEELLTKIRLFLMTYSAES